MIQSAIKKRHESAAGGSTPERLLDSATALSRDQGFAPTTTREIAASVGIQQASLYYHAKSKEELLYQVFLSSLDRLQADVGSAVPQEHDPLPRVHTFIRSHLVLLLEIQASNVTMITELRPWSGHYRAEVVARRQRKVQTGRHFQT